MEIVYINIDNFNINNALAYIGNFVTQNIIKSLNSYIDTESKNIAIASMYLKILSLKKHNLKWEDLKYSEGGKPYIKNNIYYFSISHSKNFCFYGEDHMPIGIDIEFIKYDTKQSLINHFAESEKKLINDSLKPNTEFYKIWCCKESVIKLLDNKLKKAINQIIILHEESYFTYYGKNKYYFYVDEFDGCIFCICQQNMHTKILKKQIII